MLRLMADPMVWFRVLANERLERVNHAENWWLVEVNEPADSVRVQLDVATPRLRGPVPDLVRWQDTVQGIGMNLFPRYQARREVVDPRVAKWAFFLAPASAYVAWASRRCRRVALPLLLVNIILTTIVEAVIRAAFTVAFAEHSTCDSVATRQLQVHGAVDGFHWEDEDAVRRALSLGARNCDLHAYVLLPIPLLKGAQANVAEAARLGERHWEIVRIATGMHLVQFANLPTMIFLIARDEDSILKVAVLEPRHPVLEC
jgi:hypothetical protein